MFGVSDCAEEERMSGGVGEEDGHGSEDELSEVEDVPDDRISPMEVAGCEGGSDGGVPWDVLDG